MGTYRAPDPLAALLAQEQARIIDCLQQFADGQGAGAITAARRIMSALLEAETTVLQPAFARVSLRLEAQLLLETMRDDRAQQLEALYTLARKRAPRSRKLAAIALADVIRRHAQQHTALLIPVLASQLPRPVHRSLAQAFSAHYEAALQRSASPRPGKTRDSRKTAQAA
jgi:hypothetical protein